VWNKTKNPLQNKGKCYRGLYCHYLNKNNSELCFRWKDTTLIISMHSHLMSTTKHDLLVKLKCSISHMEIWCKYFILCSTEVRNSYRFGTRRRVNYDRILMFVWTIKHEFLCSIISVRVCARARPRVVEKRTETQRPYVSSPSFSSSPLTSTRTESQCISAGFNIIPFNFVSTSVIPWFLKRQTTSFKS